MALPPLIYFRALLRFGDLTGLLILFQCATGFRKGASGTKIAELPIGARLATFDLLKGKFTDPTQLRRILPDFPYRRSSYISTFDMKRITGKYVPIWIDADVVDTGSAEPIRA